jgi:haloalkane dehalogenase
MISAAFPYQKKRRRVLDSEMAYVEVGEGDPIVLLHSNPTAPALTEKTVAGIHFVQDDSPDEIGRAIAGSMLML